MGIGPVPAVAKLFARTGLSFDQLALVQLNEAFAVQVLAVLKGWGWADHDRLNINGSGISLAIRPGIAAVFEALAELSPRAAVRTYSALSGRGTPKCPE
jgi:acetyl-CoA C-acetyltransferase